MKALCTERVLSGKDACIDEKYTKENARGWNSNDERTRIGACMLGDRWQALVYRRASERSFVDYFLGERYHHAYSWTIVFAFANLRPISPILRILIDV